MASQCDPLPSLPEEMSSGEEHDAKVAVSSETRPTDLPTTAALSSPTTKEQDNGETAASSALPSGATTPALPDLTMPDKVVEALRSASFPTANGSTSTGDENDKTTDRAVILGIAVVDFNHLVGPQVEYAHPKELAEDEELCGKLPFLALPDGSHLVRMLETIAISSWSFVLTTTSRRLS